MGRRVLERLDALYAIGGSQLGASRTAYTELEDEAHGLVSGWMEEGGLEVEVDPAGNLYGRLRGRRSEWPEVWTGSHVDSVPSGGRFDGALGVVAGLEAVLRVGKQERTTCVVAFRDEEGWRFGRGCFGSRALCGQLEAGELDAADLEGIVLRDALGRDLPAGGWLASPPAAYVETHIEQGPTLERLGCSLGVVTAIAGLARLSVTFAGREGHAGTTPMSDRDDALCKAAEYVLGVRAAAERIGAGAVATVGRIAVVPNAANVIPGEVAVIVDARAETDEAMAALVETLREAAGESSVELLRRSPPVPMAAAVRSAIAGALAATGLSAPELPSGAGHDAGVLATAGVPAGVLFVRSRNGGISHSPDEHSDDADVELAVDALARTLERLAS